MSLCLMLQPENRLIPLTVLYQLNQRQSYVVRHSRTISGGEYKCRKDSELN
jgi:hypothetical protein